MICWDRTWLPLSVTTLAATVNALSTGLIVFKIRKVFMEVGAASSSIDRTLDSTGGTRFKFRHIMFVIVESGMTLFVIQLVRTALFADLVPKSGFTLPLPVYIALDYFDVLVHVFNVIIRSVHLYFFYLTEIIYLVRASHQQ